MSVRGQRSSSRLANADNQDSDLSDSEYETAGETDADEDEEDNEWSGENGNLESLVVAAVDGDLALAAFLIPLLHKDLNLAVKSKVESWQCTTSHGNSDSPGGKSEKSNPSRGQESGSGGSRKRRRRSSSTGGRREDIGGGWEGEDGEDDEDNQGVDSTPAGPPDSTSALLLACPFHKHDPVKYGIQHTNPANGKRHKYRACVGPGFKSIQRLK